MNDNENNNENLLYRIVSGKTIFDYLDEEYLLKSPTIDIKYKASLLYNKIISEEKYQNWIREEDIEKIMISLGIWNTNTNDIINALYKRLDDLKVDLFKVWMMPSQQKTIRKNIEHIKKQLNKILAIKYNFYNHTLEGYASSIKNEYLICQTLYKNNKLAFDFNNKSNSKSYAQYNSIVQEIEKMSIGLHDIKVLARSITWKSYWSANKNHNIFDGAVIDWTDDQRTLFKVSQMYDNINEHPECPENIVIEDDDMLDGWMIIQQREQNKAKKEKRLESSNKGLKNATEVFLFPKDQEEFSDIMSLNSVESKMAIKEKMDFIQKKGSAEEYELPDVKRNIQATINEMNKRLKNESQRK